MGEIFCEDVVIIIWEILDWLNIYWVFYEML